MFPRQSAAPAPRRIVTRVEYVAAARAAALDALTSVSHGDSLCSITHDRLPAAKYHEGAVAALGDALRAERAGSMTPVARQWGSLFEARAEHDAGWRAYLLGGREALAALVLDSQEE